MSPPTITALDRGDMEEMDRIMPKAFNGWSLSDESERYFPRNLFDYINGGAELYLSFGFKKLHVGLFHKEKGPSLEVDIFDMGSSENAFGVFRHDLEDKDVGIGQGSEYGGAWLRFWKGKYYVYIYAEGQDSSTQQALLGLGRHIADRIERTGAKPDLVKRIPKQGLIPRSLRFFHNHTCLNYYYYLASENILRLSDKTNGLFVKYNTKDRAVPLVLIEYEDPAQAKQAYRNFLSTYLPEAEQSEAIQTENGKWAGAISHNQYLVIVLDALNQDGVRLLIQETLKLLP